MKFVVLFASLISMSLCSEVTSDLNSYSNEAKQFGEAELLNLRTIFSKKNQRDEKNFEPKIQVKQQQIDVSNMQRAEDQGKVLSDEKYLEEGRPPSFFEEELDGFLRATEAYQKKKEEEVSTLLDDPIFNRADLFEKGSKLGIKIILEEMPKEEEKDSIDSCVESGKYQAFVKLNLDVSTQLKQVPGKVWVCKGHKIEREEKSPDRANTFRKRKLEELEKDSDIESSSVENRVEKVSLKKRKVCISYQHKDGFKCENSYLGDRLVQVVEENDCWSPEDFHFYNHLKENAECRVEFEQFSEEGETRLIENHPVYRASWEKRICFSCGIKEDPKCQILRKNGGKLVGKKCLQETDHGECQYWHKDYELPESKKALESRVVLNPDDIWGVGDEFTSIYEKNRDFGSVMASLSLLGDLKKEVQKNPQDLNLKLKIFEGQPFICKKNKLQNALYDCCGSLSGGLIKLGIMDCNAHEKELQKAREDGRTTWIGKQKKLTLEGWSETNCYCVFPTKLARIVQEYSRTKGVAVRSKDFPWGTIESPNCDGLSLEQLISLDFEEMDLSELMGDFVKENTQRSSSRDTDRHLSELNPNEMEIEAKELMQGMVENE